MIQKGDKEQVHGKGEDEVWDIGKKRMGREEEALHEDRNCKKKLSFTIFSKIKHAYVQRVGKIKKNLLLRFYKKSLHAYQRRAPSKETYSKTCLRTLTTVLENCKQKICKIDRQLEKNTQHQSSKNINLTNGVVTPGKCVRKILQNIVSAADTLSQISCCP